MSVERRRFPAPWTAEETDACFIVRDHNGQPLAYVYFEEEPGRRTAANLLTRDEARRIALNMAKLPELLSAASRPDANPLFHRSRRRVDLRRCVDPEGRLVQFGCARKEPRFSWFKKRLLKIQNEPIWWEPT
jgi:hypothetical protein